ncbi:hypothetical protein P8H27_01790 [Pseudomonas sp. sp1636]|uniref:hypothetical protein n=1 Tax=Pseudomonas sp. sp1636 TaxID=3036707 RepID=UPI0025A566AD|nr:hypothetical protein [Pseudomonas sp. sp1636]MDM8347631.1 hypothetical protein [Pseudomonas sp. sp1636]
MRPITLSFLSQASGTCSHAAFASQPLSTLITEGKPILDPRHRYAHVDRDNALNHANAQPLGTRVGFQSGKWYGLSALIEADNLSRIGFNLSADSPFVPTLIATTRETLLWPMNELTSQYEGVMLAGS